MYSIEEIQALSKTKNSAKTNEAWSPDFLKRHHLEGFAYSMGGESQYHSHWKDQVHKNLIVRDELQKLGATLSEQGVTVCLLKGFSLMGDIYQDWGARFASDVDMLVGIGDLWRLSDALKLAGYRKTYEPKWLGNRFKFMFYKKTAGMEVCVEVHTQLFWHSHVDWKEGLRPASIVGFKSLSLETQLMHLCGHLGFQHTFLKLFWLVDIHKFVERYREQIQWPRFWSRCLQQGLYKSSFLSLEICKGLGLEISTELSQAPQKYPLARRLLKRFVTLRFLHNPRKYPIRYFMVKNLIKDSLWLNWKYSWSWLQERLRKRSARNANAA